VLGVRHDTFLPDVPRRQESRRRWRVHGAADGHVGAAARGQQRTGQQPDRDQARHRERYTEPPSGQPLPRQFSGSHRRIVRGRFLLLHRLFVLLFGFALTGPQRQATAQSPTSRPADIALGNPLRSALIPTLWPDVNRTRATLDPKSDNAVNSAVHGARDR
jgi:hypothetical protein